MIICSSSNIDLIQGVSGYGTAADGATDWRIENTATGVFNVLNSPNLLAPNLSIIESGNVGIGTIPTTGTNKLQVQGNINVSGGYFVGGVALKPATAVLADTATILASSRNIAGVGFNGSAAIDIPYFNLTNKITAGNGISLTTGSASTSPSISTNLTAGTGISISAAASPTISANLTAGTNVTFTGTAPNITINAAGGTSQWTTTGNNIYYNTGNVGIGTATPSTAKLEVWGNLLMSSTNWVQGATVRILGLNTDKMIEFSFDNGTSFYDNSTLRFITNTTERMRIASNGNIGIGTTTINNKLHVCQGTTGTTGANCFPLRISAGAYSDTGNNTATLIGLGTQETSSYILGDKCAIGHCRTNTYDRGAIVFLSNNSADATSCTMSDERMRITTNGNVGIGITNPGFRLEVSGVVSQSSVNAAYLGSSGVSTYGGPWSVTAKFNGDVWTTAAFFASSDSRIKEDIQDINDDNALLSILSIEPKTYKYVDKITRSNKKVYGFIAQQIKDVIPEAVVIDKSYIPNIYSVADYNSNVITLPSQPTKVVIKVDDKIKCYDKDNKELLVEVIEVIDDLTFRIKDIEYSDTEIFVYGTFVDDFHTLNKDYIFTLNVCATQELHRRIEAQSLLIQSHEDRIKELETKMERMLSGTT